MLLSDYQVICVSETRVRGRVPSESLKHMLCDGILRLHPGSLPLDPAFELLFPKLELEQFSCLFSVFFFSTTVVYQPDCHVSCTLRSSSMLLTEGARLPSWPVCYLGLPGVVPPTVVWALQSIVSQANGPQAGLPTV